MVQAPTAEKLKEDNKKFIRKLDADFKAWQELYDYGFKILEKKSIHKENIDEKKNARWKKTA